VKRVWSVGWGQVRWGGSKLSDVFRVSPPAWSLLVREALCWSWCGGTSIHGHGASLTLHAHPLPCPPSSPFFPSLPVFVPLHLCVCVPLSLPSPLSSLSPSSTPRSSAWPRSSACSNRFVSGLSRLLPFIMSLVIISCQASGPCLRIIQLYISRLGFEELYLKSILSPSIVSGSEFACVRMSFCGVLSRCSYLVSPYLQHSSSSPSSVLACIGFLGSCFASVLLRLVCRLIAF
jgi:hypothetical protein